MEILITGGAGFIGTHLARRLLTQGHSITILDSFLPQVHGASQEIARDLRDHVHLIRGDVADPSTLERALRPTQVLVHLAAETGTGQSMYQVARYGRTNLMGATELCDLLIRRTAKKLERLVVASSRAIYGEGAYRCAEHGVVYPRSRTVEDKARGLFDPFCPVCGGECVSIPTQECAPFQPSSFYGLTKQVQEQMMLMFAGVMGIPGIALRYQNVFGPGQSLENPYTGILAIFSNLALQSRTIRVFEDGAESRDFVYIDDVVAATCAGVQLPLKGCMALNVGSNCRTTVLEVANAINKFHGETSEIQITGEFRDGDIRHGLADLSDVRSVLDYRPKWSFSDGLSAFLEWAMQTKSEGIHYEQSLAEMKRCGLLHGR